MRAAIDAGNATAGSSAKAAGGALNEKWPVLSTDRPLPFWGDVEFMEDFVKQFLAEWNYSS